MKDERNYFVVGKERQMRVGRDMVSDLNFNGGIKEFFLTLRVKLSELECVDPHDIHIMEFKADCYHKSIPEEFVVSYVVYSFYEKDEIEKAYRGYIESIGGKVNSMRFSSETKSITIDCDLPKSMEESYRSKYGDVSLGSDVKKSYPGFYPMIFFNPHFK